MKGIKCCGECAYYSMKKHKCMGGAKDAGNAKDSYYADCPLDDAEPVRHGRWIEPDSETIGKYRDDGCVAYYTCSCCKEISKTDYDFCPNCGARMDATDTNVGGKGGADNG